MSDAPLPRRTRVGIERHNETKNLAALLILNILYHQYLHFFSLNTEPPFAFQANRLTWVEQRAHRILNAIAHYHTGNKFITIYKTPNPLRNYRNMRKLQLLIFLRLTKHFAGHRI